MQKFLVAIVAFASLLMSPSTFGQWGNSTISGTVADAAGMMISGVTVAATNAGTGIIMTAQTNYAGIYTFPSLTPGIYKVELIMQKFQAGIRKDVPVGGRDVKAGDATQLRLDFKLGPMGAIGFTDADLKLDSALDAWLSESGNLRSETKKPEPPPVNPATTSAPEPKEVAAEMRKLLPAGWTCTLISEKGKMGHPHGLNEPLFRLDFINTGVTFPAGIRKRKYLDVNPNLRLHFHAIAEREEVLKTIRAEMGYSWDVPIKFTETKDYIIVTSPLWKNHYTKEVGGTTWAAGDSSDAASMVLRPLLQALKKYFDARE